MPNCPERPAVRLRPSYFSVAATGQSEFIEKKSRFIGICAPVESVQEAEDFVRRQRQSYPDARHCVYAWSVCEDQEQYLRFSDDGEPQGTGGKPVLNVLQARSVDNVAICVIRYFGGILLGTGGLTRAYSKAAADALSVAQVVEYQLKREFTVQVDYGRADKLRHRLSVAGFVQSAPHYAEAVRWQIAAADCQQEELLQIIAEVTADSASVEVGDYKYHCITEED